MDFITCPDCGEEVSDAATACPNCERPMAEPQTPEKRIWWQRGRNIAMLVLVGLLIIVAIATC